MNIAQGGFNVALVTTAFVQNTQAGIPHKMVNP